MSKRKDKSSGDAPIAVIILGAMALVASGLVAYVSFIGGNLPIALGCLVFGISIVVILCVGFPNVTSKNKKKKSTNVTDTTDTKPNTERFIEHVATEEQVTNNENLNAYKPDDGIPATLPMTYEAMAHVETAAPIAAPVATPAVMQTPAPVASPATAPMVNAAPVGAPQPTQPIEPTQPTQPTAQPITAAAVVAAANAPRINNIIVTAKHIMINGRVPGKVEIKDQTIAITPDDPMINPIVVSRNIGLIDTGNEQMLALAGPGAATTTLAHADKRLMSVLKWAIEHGTLRGSIIDPQANAQTQAAVQAQPVQQMQPTVQPATQPVSQPVAQHTVQSAVASLATSSDSSPTVRVPKPDDDKVFAQPPVRGSYADQVLGWGQKYQDTLNKEHGGQTAQAQAQAQMPAQVPMQAQPAQPTQPKKKKGLKLH